MAKPAKDEIQTWEQRLSARGLEAGLPPLCDRSLNSPSGATILGIARLGTSEERRVNSTGSSPSDCLATKRALRNELSGRADVLGILRLRLSAATKKSGAGTDRANRGRLGVPSKSRHMGKDSRSFERAQNVLRFWGCTSRDAAIAGTPTLRRRGLNA